MNWKLIFQLSLLGLGMAIATVFWIPEKIEPLFWLVIFVICAYVIAKNCAQKFFLHGFFVSLVNSVWITTAHIIWFTTFMQNHPGMQAMNEGMPMQENPRLFMALVGPVFGAASGVVLGAFAVVASKLINKAYSKL